MTCFLPSLCFSHTAARGARARAQRIEGSELFTTASTPARTNGSLSASTTGGTPAEAIIRRSGATASIETGKRGEGQRQYVLLHMFKEIFAMKKLIVLLLTGCAFAL